METGLATLKKTVPQPCIWMQAGVAPKKRCTHFFDCTTCKYDAGMARAAAAGRQLTWQEALRRRDSTDRACRHALTGRTGHRICPMNYNCGHCDFDQTLEDALIPGSPQTDGTYDDVKGFRVPRGHYFHSGHTWARIESGGVIRVGMDDFALKVLGCPEGLDLPLMGQELYRGESGWGIRRKDHSADVKAPVSGVITRVNQQPSADPGSMGDDPYAKGWLFTLHNPDLKGAVKPLMAEDESLLWMDREIGDLETMIEGVAGPLSADGGTLVSGVYDSLPGLGWHNLVNRFLGT